MKLILSVITLCILMLFGTTGFGQNYSFKKKFGTQKNAVYFYWGYNRSLYSKSDVNFYGPDYNITVKDLQASDRPSRNFATYVNLSTISVPQFNVRFGWYYKHRWDVSIGYDHMKYVMKKNQNLYINGDAGTTTTSQLSGTYTDATGLIPIREQDLHYENTNGLNYISIQLSNTAPLYKTKNRKFAIQRRAGMGAGPIVTQTDFEWDGVAYHTNFGFSGYGISAHGGLRFDFFNRFFLASNWSGGFIHLPKNRTAPNDELFAKQKFVYGQWELLGGVLFYLKTKNGCDTCPDWH
ncbi:MAG: hypothetical protein GQ574_27790 [Crocinitomix sp.]|nr:hypothetical protein [Crocinitomix sp.]